MKILAIESSSQVASVAVLEDDVIKAECTVNNKINHSQILLPLVNETMEKAELQPMELDAIAISSGPGSFTGLRIGCATAKGLGLALDIPLINVPTLEAMAYNMYGTDMLVCPIMDARRAQTYTGIYQFVDGSLEPVVSSCAIAIEELINKLNEFGRKTIFVGDGIPVFKAIIDDKATFEHEYAPAGRNRQLAQSVANLGAIYYRMGKVISADEQTPEYLRVSQAEREREEKLAEQQ